MLNASSKQAQAAGVTSPLPVICHVSWRVVPSRPSSRSCSEASRTSFWPIVMMFGLAERQSADPRSLSAFGCDCLSNTASLGVVLRSSQSTEQSPKLLTKGVQAHDVRNRSKLGQNDRSNRSLL